MGRAPTFGKSDAIILLTLLGATVVIALPILEGGYRTYIDNSVHVAEIYELSRGTEWSEIAFTGFPAKLLHSPLWFGALATLVSWGVPLGPPYALMCLIGFAAPSLAIYWVARQRISKWGAATLAYLVLVQPTMAWGIGSSLGGMWTSAIGAALAIVFADLIAPSRASLRRHVAAAFVLALIGLTHFFALLIAVLLVIATAIDHFVERNFSIEDYKLRVVVWLVAATASAGYWLGFLMTADLEAAGKDVMSFTELAYRLLLPTDAMLIIDHRPEQAVHYGLHLTDALPIAGLVVLGVVGRAFFRKQQDTLGRSGFLVAAFLLVGIAIEPYYPLPFLGPVSWRLLFWVRLGLALAAIGLVGRISFRALERAGAPAAVAAALAAVGMGLWWGRPLRQQATMPKNELADVESLWRWLEENRDEEWGRIYLQDSFGPGWESGAPISRSHLLVLTYERLKLPQLGSYYGVTPFHTRWTMGEMGQLFTGRGWNDASLRGALRNTNAGLLVVSAQETRARLERVGKSFDRLYQIGRYSVWRDREAKSAWINPLRPTNEVSGVQMRGSEIAFDVKTKFPRARVLVKSSFHPSWHLEGPPGSTLRESPVGHLVVDNIPVGSYRIRLRYEDDPLPRRLGWAGWVLLAVGGALSWRRKRPADEEKTPDEKKPDA